MIEMTQNDAEALAALDLAHEHGEIADERMATTMKLLGRYDAPLVAVRLAFTPPFTVTVGPARTVRSDR